MSALSDLHKQIRLCARCPLRAGATAPVPGIGPEQADYFLIGEAPGQSEDNLGVPFVGWSGKRLNRLMEAGKLDLNRCYLTNTVKCRPPDNRQPLKAERLACYGWLHQELLLVQPKCVVTIGALPLALFSKDSLKNLHGTMFFTEPKGDLPAYKVIGQYHPAASAPNRNPRLWGQMLTDWAYQPTIVNPSYIPTRPSFDNNTIMVPALASLDTENDPSGGIGEWSFAYRDAEGKLCVTSLSGAQRLSYKGRVIMHHAKHDLRVLRANGMAEPTDVVDTMIAAYCLGCGKQDTKDGDRDGGQMVGGLGLKYLARRQLGMPMKTWEEVKDHPEWKRDYNAADSVATYLLWEKWTPDIPAHFWSIDMPLLPVLMRMEDRGAMVDPDFLKKYADTLDSKLKDIDLPLNPFSPKQVADYVYNTLGYPVEKYTDTKQPSTDKEVLETIDDPIVKRILEYRDIYKEKRTYVSGYAQQSQGDGRIHCEFKQTSTITGRLSAVRPNLQNVKKIPEMRSLFVAPQGKKIVCLDYSQLDLRALAAITCDENMRQIFAQFDKTHDKQYSIHARTAAATGLKYDDAKTLNFLMTFGGTEYKIAEEFHIPIDEGKDIRATFLDAYPGVAKFITQQKIVAHEKREVQTWMGRKVRLDGMYSEHWKTISDTERQAINIPVQGTEGEIVKLAMIALDKKGAPIILQVHDELLFEVDERDAPEYAKWLEEYVPTITEINGFRFPVEVKFGQNWYEAKGH